MNTPFPSSCKDQTNPSSTRTLYREAAYALCAYVDPTEGDVLDFDPPFVDVPHEPLGVIELGSGTGVVAATIARMIRRAVQPGGFVIATDLPDVCPLLKHNLGLNTERSANRSDFDAIFVRPLTWGILGHATSIANEFGLVQPFASRRLTHIVCSDLASIDDNYSSPRPLTILCIRRCTFQNFSVRFSEP